MNPSFKNSENTRPCVQFSILKNPRWLKHFNSASPCDTGEDDKGAVQQTQSPGRRCHFNTMECLRICNSTVSAGWPPRAAPSAVKAGIHIPVHPRAQSPGAGEEPEGLRSPTSSSPWHLQTTPRQKTLGTDSSCHSLLLENSFYMTLKPLLDWAPLDYLSLTRTPPPS